MKTELFNKKSFRDEFKTAFYFASLYLEFMYLREHDSDDKLYIVDHGLIQCLSSLVWDKKNVCEKSDSIINYIAEHFSQSVDYVYIAGCGAEETYKRIMGRKWVIRLHSYSRDDGIGILNNIEKLPFLVIEPAKTEYVDWALEYNKKHPESPIDIYVPGCKKYKGEFIPKPLKLNPFELVWLKPEQEVNVLTHIDRLKSTFASAFPMYDILPVLMEDLIYTVYQQKTTDWLSGLLEYGKTLFPTLNSMSVCVDKVIEHRQYEDKVQRNMKACLNTRIDSLKRGWKGEMLNTTKSTAWQDLFQGRCVVNLSYVGDDVDKAFFMALLLQFLYEYRSAQAEIGEVDYNENGCKHLTVIEEAHRVMSKCENQELPQYKSAMMFSNMLSEIRAYGEGLILVDQVPTRLIPDAIKNTNLKITHRLVAEDDCKAIGESMGLSDEQRKVIPKLLTGQCIVSSSLSTGIYWVKADKVK